MKQVLNKWVRRISRSLICLIPHTKNQFFSYEEAEKILNSHHSDPRSSCLNRNKINKKEYDLTIIVPVYNVEKFLAKCMGSIFNQKTDFSYEVIAVDDGSTDCSGQILKSFSCEKNFVIINQKNCGVSCARNNALQMARGNYIMFVDSDDYLTENTIESLVGTAYRCNADIVQGGYYCISQCDKKCLGIVKYDDNMSVLPNGVIAGMPWGKVYDSKLFENVCFPAGYWHQDTIITSIITHLATNIATVSDIVYYYRDNKSGITHKSRGNPKSLDTFYVLRSTLNARKELNMHTDKAFYEHLLRLIILSYRRTKREPEIVKRSMFSLFKKMLEEERGEQDFQVAKQYRNLENTIVTGDYRRYCFLCSLL